MQPRDELTKALIKADNARLQVELRKEALRYNHDTLDLWTRFNEASKKSKDELAGVMGKEAEIANLKQQVRLLKSQLQALQSKLATMGGSTYTRSEFRDKVKTDGTYRYIDTYTLLTTAG